MSWGASVKKLDDYSIGVSVNAVRRNSLDNNNSSRKSSINPQHVEFLKRSRFNSRADEFKMNKTSNPDQMNELVTILGGDIQFYQCFKLNEDEIGLIKEFNSILTSEWIKLISLKISLDEFRQNEELFLRLVEDVPCEKFIAVGHILEIMFSKNSQEAQYIRQYLLYFFDSKVVDAEDIKHGYIFYLESFFQW